MKKTELMDYLANLPDDTDIYFLEPRPVGLGEVDGEYIDLDATHLTFEEKTFENILLIG